MRINKQALRIGITGALLYILFEKSYYILSTLSLWGCMELSIDNQFISSCIHSCGGIIALLILIYTSKHYFNKPKITNKNIVTIGFILIGLFITLNIINKLHGKYLDTFFATNKSSSFHYAYSIQYESTILIGSVFSVIAFIFFMIKVKVKKNDFS